MKMPLRLSSFPYFYVVDPDTQGVKGTVARDFGLGFFYHDP
jgi:hypothetical protein